MTEYPVVISEHMEEHFKYEVWMMMEIWKRMNPSPYHYPPLDQFMINVYHEAFCVHVYNLLVFLLDEGGADLPEDVLEVLWKIENQVTTLGEGRTAVMNEKIAPERKRLHDFTLEYVEKCTGLVLKLEA